MFPPLAVSVALTVANGSVSEEAMSVAACVEVAGLLEREVVVSVSSRSGSALGEWPLINTTQSSLTCCVVMRSLDLISCHLCNGSPTG